MGQEAFGDGWLQLMARASLGALLAAAAASKWRGGSDFALSLQPILGEGRLARVAPALVPWLEGATGALLLVGLVTRWAALAAAVLLLGFGLVLALRRGALLRIRCAPGLECGANGWSVARNVTLAAAAVIAALRPPDALTFDHLVFAAPAASLPARDLIPAAGLLLFAVTAGLLVPAALATTGRRPAPGIF